MNEHGIGSTEPSGGAGYAGTGAANIAAQVGALARRSIVRTMRQPAAIVFPLIFPMLLLLVNSGGLKASTKLPGFPTDSFLAFALAVPFIQGALFSTMNAGTDLARDIQTGFLNRLSLTSMRGLALIAGQLAGVVVMGLVQATFYIAVGLIVGVDFAAGALGILTLLGFAAVISIGFGAIGTWLALRTGSGEAIQGLFPLLFVFLFLSSMNTPRNLIGVDWFRAVATANPVSYLIECVRSLIITGWNGEALALGFGIAVVIGIVATLLSTISLKERLART
jgi:ABC-2 type transport system permease protein